ncbi:probable palmitoyltransferase ZDHHC24 [Biomphalaria glabrata]|uniref:Palmitoyltransferase n=1 Tax=Biomphalaria glabrata TaxID=6526 RepID=A0A9W3B951_BIOGL|nr:probable palmitoyltransferase ZDHHC24 [Biomphalaria glabrata]
MLHLPRTRNDKLLFIVFWLGGLFTLYYECCLVLASYHDSWNGYVTFHVTFSAVLALYIYLYMFMLIRSDISTNSIIIKNGDLSEGWKYCQRCQRNAPPRSHHCKCCDLCILKRDHHCWFAGYCVGYSNHRYFICMAFYMSLAGIYANVYNWEFFLKVKGGLAWSTVPGLLAPHVGLIFGVYSWYEFFITLTTTVGALFTFLFVWLLAIQIIQFSTGQVKYERKNNIFDYATGYKNTFKEIFGSAGLWVFLIPFIPTKLPGDGTRFAKVDRKLN